MRELPCDEIDEVLPAYALDALDEEEYIDVALHLAECRNHDDDLAAYRATANDLATALDPLVPSPGLRASLLEAFEASLTRPVEIEAPQQLPRARPRPLWAPSFAYGLAAALLLLAIGLGAWNLTLRSDDSNDALAGIVRREVQLGAQRLEVIYLPKADTAILSGVMDPLPDHLDYQAWRITSDGKPESLGVMPRRGDTALTAPLDGSKVIAVTIEPRGGSAAPTTAPIITTEL